VHRITFSGGEAYEAQVSCDLGLFEGFEDHSKEADPDAKEAVQIEAQSMQDCVLLQMEPAKRHALRALDPLMSKQGPVKDPAWLAQKAKRKQDMKEATVAAMRNWKAQALKDSKGSSRQDILEKVLLRAGKAVAQGKAEGKAVKAKKIKAGHGNPYSTFFVFHSVRFSDPPKN